MQTHTLQDRIVVQNKDYQIKKKNTGYNIFIKNRRITAVDIEHQYEKTDQNRIH